MAVKSVIKRVEEVESRQHELHALLLSIDAQVTRLQDEIQECNTLVCSNAPPVEQPLHPNGGKPAESSLPTKSVCSDESAPIVSSVSKGVVVPCRKQMEQVPAAHGTHWSQCSMEERLKMYPDPPATLNTSGKYPSYCLSRVYTSRNANHRRKPWMPRQTPFFLEQTVSAGRINSGPSHSAGQEALNSEADSDFIGATATASISQFQKSESHATALPVTEHPPIQSLPSTGSSHSPSNAGTPTTSFEIVENERLTSQPVDSPRACSPLVGEIESKGVKLTETSASPLSFSSGNGRLKTDITSSPALQRRNGAVSTSRLDRSLSPAHPTLNRAPSPSRVRAAIDHTRNVGFGLRQHTVYHCVAYDRAGMLLEADRRYNDFVMLRNVIHWQYPNLKSVLPPLPGKRMLGKLQSSVVEQRRLGLQTFLQFVVSHPILQHDEDLVLKPWFLRQS